MLVQNIFTKNGKKEIMQEFLTVDDYVYLFELVYIEIYMLLYKLSCYIEILV